jgi:hypothetical protein
MSPQKELGHDAAADILFPPFRRDIGFADLRAIETEIIAAVVTQPAECRADPEASGPATAHLLGVGRPAATVTRATLSPSGV